MDTTLTDAPAPKKKVVRRKKRKPYASKAPKVERKAELAQMAPVPKDHTGDLAVLAGGFISQATSPPTLIDQHGNVFELADKEPPYTEEQLRSGSGVPPEVKALSDAMTEMENAVHQQGQEILKTLHHCIPVIPYWSAMWKPCADAFASNVDCVIVINVPPHKKELGFWRSAIKTLLANQLAETQSRERKGRSPVQVRLVGYLSPHHDETTTRAQMRRYEQELQIREFWADGRKRGPNILDCDHYGDEHTPLPSTIAQEGTLRVGYATNKTWRAEWEKARQTGRYVAMLEDVSMLMPPNWWRDWLRSQLTK